MSIAEPEAFASVFAHWEPEVQALITCVEKPMQWAIHTVRPLPSYVSGRVALLGDAAHAMTPNQGSGAGQAIEDAYLLATVLGHPGTNRNNVHRALKVYDAIRRPAAHTAVEMSRINGRYFTFELDGVDLDTVHPRQQWDSLQRIGKAVVKNWEWAWTTSFRSTLQDALHMLESMA